MTARLEEDSWRRQQELVEELWPEEQVPGWWALDARSLAGTPLDHQQVAQSIRELAAGGHPRYPSPEVVIRHAVLAGAGGPHRQRAAEIAQLTSGVRADPGPKAIRPEAALMSGQEDLAPKTLRSTGPRSSLPVLFEQDAWRRQQELVEELWPDDEVPDSWARTAWALAGTPFDHPRVTQSIRELVAGGHPRYPSPEVVIRHALLAGAGGPHRQRAAEIAQLASGVRADAGPKAIRPEAALMSGQEDLAPTSLRYEPPPWVLILVAVLTLLVLLGAPALVSALAPP